MPLRSPLLAALLLAAASVCRLGAVPYGAGDHDVSEYMMGSVTVNIIFPESSASSPDTEDWTAFRKASVESSIRAAMDWWAAREPEARLSFVYNVTTQNTDYEPISCYASAAPPPGGCSEGDWIGDIMTKMGYSGSDYFEQVYAYDNAMRLTYGTDWAFTIFVADSFMDGDGAFPDGYFAYTYMGGPFMVLTYDNGDYGISGMSAVCAHETGHVFYALDEYAESGCATTERAGYFNAPNLNCQNGGTSEQCIMRGQLAPYDTPVVCNNTRLMLGWKDVSPANGVPDIVDLTPTTALTAYSPDPTTDNTPTYYGIAHSTAVYPNANQYGAPAMRFYYETPPPIKDISVLRIAAVEYQADAGAWQQASPRDSGFDSVVDSFTFTITT
ncbi:MAG TPA: hypothetical protein PL037_09480, partial [Elusimicrobiales bacterium]|nr:hypothetical protein [Elusimicrobiales bacterium]